MTVLQTNELVSRAQVMELLTASVAFNPTSHCLLSARNFPLLTSAVRLVAKASAVACEKLPYAFWGIAVSQMAWRFVDAPLKMTLMLLPPTSRFSTCRG